MLFAQFNIPDFEGLAWSVAGPALAGIAFVLFIVVIIVGTLAGTLGASIGWNLTRNTKAGPDETEKSKRRRHPWWARLGISLGAGSVGIGACAFSLHLWLTFIKTGYEMENAESCFLMVAIPGALLGASGAAWLQRRMNVKTNQKWYKGIASMLLAGSFFGPVLLIIIVSAFGIPIRYNSDHPDAVESRFKDLLHGEFRLEFDRSHGRKLRWSAEAPDDFGHVHGTKPLSNRWLKAFRRLDRLEAVTLGGPQIDDEFMDYLIEKRTLTVLDLSEAEITSIGLQKLKGMNLSQLRIPVHLVTPVNARHYLNALSPSAQENFALHKWQIEALNFHGNGKGDHHGEIQNGHAVLRFVYDNTALAIVKELGREFPLDLDIERISTAELQHLKGLPNLRNLSITGFAEDPDASTGGLVHLKALRGLQSLDISFWKVTDTELSSLQGMKLKSLSIPASTTTRIGLENYLAALETMPNVLDLSDWLIEDDALELLKGLSSLESLSLKNTAITDTGLLHLKDLNNLKKLDLAWNGSRPTGGQVTNVGLAHLKDLSSLQELDLKGSRGVTNAGLAHLSGLPGLRSLNLTRCSVTKAAITQLQKTLPNCHIRASRHADAIASSPISGKLFDYHYKDNGTVLDRWHAGGEVVIPTAIRGLPVVAIGTEAFKGNSFIKKVTLPPTVREIQASAFEGCKDLEIVNLPPALEKIGYKAFSNCPRLSAITLPATLTGIGDYAFEKSGIKSITLPPGEFSPRIGKAAFQGGVYMEAIKKQRWQLFGSLIDEAIPAKTLGRKPSQGEILYYPPNQQTPYTGWVKHVRKGEDQSESRPRQSGRFVRIDHPGDNKMIHVAEVQVFRDGKNIARQGKATQSSTDFGGPPERAIDGNTDGNYKNNSVTHTAVSKDPWLEIDLGAISAVDKIVIWNRTDGQTQSRLDGSMLSILDEKRETVWKQAYANISVLTQYKDGKKDGREISWYQNGNKKQKRTYKRDQLMAIADWTSDGEKLSGSTLVIIAKTHTGKDAGTDNSLKARLIGLDKSVGSSWTLDNPDINDRESGSIDTYLLPFDDPTTEIQGIELVVKGKDAWRAATISFQFFHGEKRSKPHTFEVNQWFSSEQKDINSFGAIKSRFFPLRPEFEATQSPVTPPTAELPDVEESDLDDLEIRNKVYSEAIPWKDTRREVIAGPHHALNQQTPYTGWVKTIRNGEISVLTQYKDGRKDGREIAWHGDGKKHWDVTFKENGRWFTGTWWYTNGQKVSEETYKEGKLWTARAWKINGDKCPDTNVIDGTGVRTQYNGVSGKRRGRQTFKDGQRIK